MIPYKKCCLHYTFLPKKWLSAFFLERKLSENTYLYFLYKKTISWRFENYVIILLRSHHNLHPFVPYAPFLYPLKTSENRKNFWCFLGLEKGCTGNEWVESINLKLRTENFSSEKLYCWCILRTALRKGILHKNGQNYYFYFTIWVFKFVFQHDA